MSRFNINRSPSKACELQKSGSIDGAAKSCARKLVRKELPVLPAPAIAATVAAIAIIANVPTAAPAIANQADLFGLYAAGIDGAEIADRQSGSGGCKSNGNGGGGKRQLDDVHVFSLWNAPAGGCPAGARSMTHRSSLKWASLNSCDDFTR